MPNSTSSTSEATNSTSEAAAAPCGIVVLDLAEDVDGRRLGLEGQVAGDQDHRAELADRTTERQADTGQDRRDQVGQDDPAGDGERARTERGGGVLHLAIEGRHHRLDRPDRERQRDEDQREHDADLGVGDVDAERAVDPVQRQQRQPGHDRRERERQVDQDIDDRTARKRVAYEHPGDQRAHHGIDRDRRRRDLERQPQRRDRLGRRDGGPELRPTAADGLPRDCRQWDQHDKAQVDDGDAEAQRRAGAGDAHARDPRTAGPSIARVTMAPRRPSRSRISGHRRPPHAPARPPVQSPRRPERHRGARRRTAAATVLQEFPEFTWLIASLHALARGRQYRPSGSSALAGHVRTPGGRVDMTPQRSDPGACAARYRAPTWYPQTPRGRRPD